MFAPAELAPLVAGALIGTVVAGVVLALITVLVKYWAGRATGMGGVAITVVVVAGSAVPFAVTGWVAGLVVGIRHPWLVAVVATSLAYGPRWLLSRDFSISPWGLAAQSVLGYGLTTQLLAADQSPAWRAVILVVLIATALTGPAATWLSERRR